MRKVNIKIHKFVVSHCKECVFCHVQSKKLEWGIQFKGKRNINDGFEAFVAVDAGFSDD